MEALEECELSPDDCLDLELWLITIGDRLEMFPIKQVFEKIDSIKDHMIYGKIVNRVVPAHVIKQYDEFPVDKLIDAVDYIKSEIHKIQGIDE